MAKYGICAQQMTKAIFVAALAKKKYKKMKREEKRQKKLLEDHERVYYCDIRAVSHSCNVFETTVSQFAFPIPVFLLVGRVAGR